MSKNKEKFLSEIKDIFSIVSALTVAASVTGSPKEKWNRVIRHFIEQYNEENTVIPIEDNKSDFWGFVKNKLKDSGESEAEVEVGIKYILNLCFPAEISKSMVFKRFKSEAKLNSEDKLFFKIFKDLVENVYLKKWFEYSSIRDTK